MDYLLLYIETKNVSSYIHKINYIHFCFEYLDNNRQKTQFDPYTANFLPGLINLHISSIYIFTFSAKKMAKCILYHQIYISYSIFILLPLTRTRFISSTFFLWIYDLSCLLFFLCFSKIQKYPTHLKNQRK